jgi:hypothetical protein
VIAGDNCRIFSTIRSQMFPSHGKVLPFTLLSLMQKRHFPCWFKKAQCININLQNADFGDCVTSRFPRCCVLFTYSMAAFSWSMRPGTQCVIEKDYKAICMPITLTSLSVTLLSYTYSTGQQRVINFLLEIQRDHKVGEVLTSHKAASLGTATTSHM